MIASSNSYRLIYLRKESNESLAALAEAYLSLRALYDAAGARDRAAELYEKFFALRPDYPGKAALIKFIQSGKKFQVDDMLSRGCLPFDEHKQLFLL